jgi:hypothetical protein
MTIFVHNQLSEVGATPILDRLLHNSRALTTRCDSYRLREKRRTGLVRPQTGGSSLPDSAGLRPPPPGEEA